MPETIDHVGDCYMAITHEGANLMKTLMHIFLVRVEKSHVALADGLFWRRADDLADAAHATKLLAAKIPTMTPDKLFFEQYSEEL